MSSLEDQRAAREAVVNDFIQQTGFDPRRFDSTVSDPTTAYREIIYFLLQKEQLYIEVLRGIIGDACSKPFAQMTPEEIDACALIQAYERRVKGVGDE